MGSDHFWVNRRTQQISSLPKFIFYTAITSCVLGVAALCFASTVIPSIVSNILFTLCIATLLVSDSSCAVMKLTCQYRKVSKEEQKNLKDRRINEERLKRNDSLDEDSETRNYSFFSRFINERFSNREKPSDLSYLLEEFNENEKRSSMRESLMSDSSPRSVYGTTIVL